MLGSKCVGDVGDAMCMACLSCLLATICHRILNEAKVSYPVFEAMSNELDLLFSVAENAKFGGSQPFWSERITHFLLNRYRILQHSCMS